MGNEISVLQDECAKKRVVSERKIARLLDIKDYLSGDFTLRCFYCFETLIILILTALCNTGTSASPYLVILTNTLSPASLTLKF